MYFVYVLFSHKDNKLYTGYTPDDPFRRLNKHNEGLVLSTKPRRPLDLIFFEAYINKNDALRREKYLKTTDDKRGIKHILRMTLISKLKN